MAEISLALQTSSRPSASEITSAFEVATVKRSGPEPGLRHFTIQGRRFVTLRTSLADLINYAYGLHSGQLVNAPNWLESEKFDVTGIPEADRQPSEKEWMAMIGNLLANRFQFRFHWDRREMAVYAIVTGRDGMKLGRSEGNANGLPAFVFQGIGKLTARNAGIGDLAWELQSMVLDRPVVDQTGLNGRFDFTLAWTPDEFQLKGRDADSTAPGTDVPPDLFHAVQQQLGLRIEAKRAAADV